MADSDGTYPDISDIIARKEAGRRAHCRLSFAEKLSALDALRDRVAPMIRAREKRRVPVYVFRDPHFAPAGDTIVSAAPADAVVRTYGGGGVKGVQGLSIEFGGAAVFRNDATNEYWLGVWGARKAARFRDGLERFEGEIEIINAPPPGRLAWYQTSRHTKKKGR